MPPTTTTTVNDILELAYANLMDVSPENLANEPVELTGLVNRSLDGFFALAASVNPWFYGKAATVSFEANEGWLRPADAEAVFRIETTEGVEVVIVPFEQRNIEVSEPTVYLFGGYYRSTELAGAPTSGDLVIYYSRMPVPAAGLDSTLDVLWPEQFNQLLGLEVAIYLAAKGNLQDEVANLKPDRDGWLSRYMTFLQHESLGKRGWSTTRRIPASAFAMLAGGA